jgi:glutamine synthetase
METGDGFDRTDTRESTAMTLKGAVTDLEKDVALTQAVGADLVANHVYMKQKEVRKTRDLEGDALRDFYVHFV